MQILRLSLIQTETGHRSDASIHNTIYNRLFHHRVANGQHARFEADYEVKAINEARIAGKSNTEIPEQIKTFRVKRISPANALAAV